MGQWKELEDDGKIHIMIINQKLVAMKTDGTSVAEGNGNILPSSDGQVFTIKNKQGEYAVINKKGDIIVPFGIYNYIDGFEKGLSRVRKQLPVEGATPPEGSVLQLRLMKSKWGVIDDKGNEILPIIFDEVWKFYNTEQVTTRVILNGISKQIRISAQSMLWLSEKIQEFRQRQEQEQEQDYPDFYISEESPRYSYEDEEDPLLASYASEIEDECAYESGEYYPDDY